MLFSVFPFCLINLTSSNSFHVLTYWIVCYSFFFFVSNGLDLNSALKLSCICCCAPFCGLSHLDLAGFQGSYLSSSFTGFHCFLPLLPFHVDAFQFCLKWIKNVFMIKNSPLWEPWHWLLYIRHPFIFKSKNKPKPTIKMSFFFFLVQTHFKNHFYSSKSLKLLFSSITAFSFSFCFVYSLAVFWSHS